MNAAALWTVVAALWAGCLAEGWWLLAPAAPAALALAGRGLSPAVRRLLLVVAAVFLVGALLSGGRQALLARGPLAELAEHGAVAEMAGVVVAEPQSTRRGSWTVVRIEQVQGERARARALLRLREGAQPPAFGERAAT